jgi:hypothetical protein
MPTPENVAGDDLVWVGSVSHCSAPEGAAGDDPAQVGSANYDPAPEGVRVGSPSCTSMGFMRDRLHTPVVWW